MEGVWKRRGVLVNDVVEGSGVREGAGRKDARAVRKGQR